MLTYQAVILGAVQGLTEFIPVSSSGHLIAVPEILGWSYQGKSFDAAVHLGTLAALLVYYRREWLSIIREFAQHLLRKTPYGENSEGRLFVPILAACIPAAAAGFLWDDFIESELSRWEPVAAALVVFGALMLAADLVGKRARKISEMRYADFIWIGTAQALALLPGVSRSGITITAGLFRGLDRASAARFSFLLSTPIILGAGLFSLKNMLESTAGSCEIGTFVWGFASAALSGYLAIHFLITYLQKRSLAVFVVYRFCLAAALVAVFALR